MNNKNVEPPIKLDGELEVEEVEVEETATSEEQKVSATRRDYQLGRRFFHMCTGTAVATGYNLMFEHSHAVYILGTGACIMYLFDQIRIAYPEFSKKFEIISKYFLRAEEQLKESSAIPYAIAILLTLITFPKAIAVASIYTLAFADPMSALFGIRFGKRKIVKGKSLEGSFAFFITTFIIVVLVFSTSGMNSSEMWAVAFCTGVFASIFEMLPIRLDDNLTIPIFTAFTLFFFCALFGLPI